MMPSSHAATIGMPTGLTWKAITRRMMPFFGEYYAAFGWQGVFCGVILYGYFSSKMIILIEKYSLNSISYIYGVSLISFYFGYYYFSRGSISQIFKGAIFIVFVYIFLIIKLRIKSVNS